MMYVCMYDVCTVSESKAVQVQVCFTLFRVQPTSMLKTEFLVQVIRRWVQYYAMRPILIHQMRFRSTHLSSFYAETKRNKNKPLPLFWRVQMRYIHYNRDTCIQNDMTNYNLNQYSRPKWNMHAFQFARQLPGKCFGRAGRRHQIICRSFFCSGVTDWE